jgi:hypothetical protein
MNLAAAEPQFVRRMLDLVVGGEHRLDLEFDQSEILRLSR